MLSYKTVTLAIAYLSLSALALPIRREVPQEHSHEPFLTSVRASLALDNPLGLVDPVFGLLGNAAATAGLGKLTDPDCLQQATADQAFTNAKAAGDVAGMVAALSYRAIERNTGKVGLASVLCTSVKAANPEIAALTQHQDPASTGAAATNKAIVLELAKQIAAVGGDPQDALKTGTFKPGDLTDTTGKGNSCDDANDAAGCIFSQNLLVEDATAAEIDAAVKGVSAAATTAADAAATTTAATDSAAATSTDSAAATSTAAAADSTATCAPPTTVTVTAAATATVAATSSAADAAATTAVAVAAATGNLQTFTGALGGSTAPPVTPGGRGFQVSGSDDFLNVAAALGRSCDIQHNKCANAANSGSAAGLTAGQCDTQNTACRAAI